MDLDEAMGAAPTQGTPAEPLDAGFGGNVLQNSIGTHLTKPVGADTRT
jgi:hypothetical protein